MISIAVGLLLYSGKAQSVVLGGDIMLNGISIAQKPLAAIASILRPAGVALANLEIPLTNATRQTPNKSTEDVRKRNQFILKADPLHASQIAASGIRMVSLGNNHCMDYRLAGLDQMESVLTKNHILFAGAGSTREAALEPAIYTAPDGRRIGLISALAFIGSAALGHCTPARKTSAGVATFPFGGTIGKEAQVDLQAMFADAKAKCDLLVVGLHWGIERQTMPTPYQVALGRACIDAGADVVWGNHPHVLQGAELYNGKPIIYSMGNLISSKPGRTGLLKLVYIDGAFARSQFLPLYITAGRVSAIKGIEAKAAEKSFRKLCESLVKRYPSKLSKPLI